MAPSDLAMAFLDPLIAWLNRHNPKIDSHLTAEAAEDAIISLIKNPASFRPTKSDLAPYLRMAAQADLRNILEREGKYRKGRISLAAVELSENLRKNLEEDDDPSLPLQTREQVQAVLDLIPPVVLEGLTDAEVKVLKLMLEKERRTKVYAEAYEITHMPVPKQRKVIKQVKDKLNKRLERAVKSNEPTS